MDAPAVAVRNVGANAKSTFALLHSFAQRGSGQVCFSFLPDCVEYVKASTDTNANYFPTCTLEAFMFCMDYRVFKYAPSFCESGIPQFVPAAIVGV
jgi:hypothetical protein